MALEMNGHKTQIIVALIALIGVLGGALITNWDKFFPPTPGQVLRQNQEPRQKSAETSSTRTDRAESVPTPSPFPAAAAINISSAWLDNWGTRSQVTQQGETFQFTSWGVGCQGAFQSSGSGTIKGNRTESTYQSTHSHGSCTGTVSQNGRQLTQTCTDSVCGQFQSVAMRQ